MGGLGGVDVWVPGWCGSNFCSDDLGSMGPWKMALINKITFVEIFPWYVSKNWRESKNAMG